MAMSFNPGVAIKQFAGIPAFAHRIGVRATIAALIQKRGAQYDADWAILTASPAYDARYGRGLNAEMAYAKDLLRRGLASRIGTAATAWADFGMRLQGLADRLVAKPIAVYAYRKARDRYLADGHSEADASRLAAVEAWAIVEDTQQSARPENQLQGINRSRWARLFTQFLSSPLQQLQFEQRAVAACLRGEEGATRRLARTLWINHVLVPVFWVAFDALVSGVLLGGLFDDDDRRRERLLLRLCSELAAGLTLGLGGSLPCFGWGAEWLIGALVGYERPTQDALTRAMGGIPAVETTSRVAWLTGKTLYHLAEAPFDPEALADALSASDDLLKQAFAPYRQGSQALRNWFGHDLDDLWEE